MEEQKKQNVLITLLVSVRDGVIPFILIATLGGGVILIIDGIISYLVNHTDTHEAYNAMEVELNAFVLPEKTILDNVDQSVGSSSWVHSTKGYSTNFPYHKLRPFYQQQFKLKGWTELGKKDASSENEEVSIYRFERKEWRLKLMTFKGKKGKPNPYAPFSYIYRLKIEWEI